MPKKAAVDANGLFLKFVPLSSSRPAEPVVHACQKLIDVRELEGSRGDIAVFDLGANVWGKAIFDAEARRCPDPFVGAIAR
jgi:hypothetical protein